MYLESALKRCKIHPSTPKARGSCRPKRATLKRLLRPSKRGRCSETLGCCPCSGLASTQEALDFYSSISDKCLITKDTIKWEDASEVPGHQAAFLQRDRRFLVRLRCLSRSTGLGGLWLDKLLSRCLCGTLPVQAYLVHD